MQSFYDLLQLETSFALDEKALETAYFAAQRAAHPDRFVGRPEAERVDAIVKSQLINEAYETLKNPLKRAEHLLELQGIFVDPEHGGDAVPPALLMEMMELREQLSDAADDGRALMATLEEIKTAAKDCQTLLAALFATQDFAQAAQETVRFNYLMKALEEAHMYLYRLKAGAR